jgi:hypothetical protein
MRDSGFVSFHDSSSQKMTLDSSGNLLVGKTAAATNVQGGELRENGQILAVATNVNPFFAARLDSDGDLIVFRKDNTTVGSIGTGGGNVIVNSASNYGILQNAGSNQYVWSSSAGAGAFYPEADNSKDLGTSSKRFQDLYLSGGVYLGGTGSANKLDDYEQGTWSPSIRATTTDPTVTYATRLGAYVIIGNTVYISFYIYCSSGNVTGGAGVIQIGDLPVAIQPNGGYSNFGLPFIPAGYVHTGGAVQNAQNNNTMRWQANANPSTKINLYASNGSSHGSGYWELSGSGTFPIA